MAGDERPKRVDLGFSGGQVLPLRMREAEHAELRSALEGDHRGWHVVKTEDSEVAVDLGQVVYVRLDTEQHQVGF
jgi:hypothetical protein